MYSHICAHVHKHIPSYTSIFLHTQVHIPSYTSIFLHTQAYSFIHKHIPSYTSIFLHTQAYSFIHKHIPSYTSIFLHTQAYSFIHKRIPSYTSIFLHTQAYSFIHKCILDIHTQYSCLIHICSYHSPPSLLAKGCWPTVLISLGSPVAVTPLQGLTGPRPTTSPRPCLLSRRTQAQRYAFPCPTAPRGTQATPRNGGGGRAPVRTRVTTTTDDVTFLYSHENVICWGEGGGGLFYCKR